jgi:hypothetical protein
MTTSTKRPSVIFGDRIGSLDNVYHNHNYLVESHGNVNDDIIDTDIFESYSSINFNQNHLKDDDFYLNNKRRRSKSEQDLSHLHYFEYDDQIPKNNNNNYTKKIKNKYIERGVRIRRVSSLIDISCKKEKQELNELNSRLKMLLDNLKAKKNLNEKLENEIKAYKENVLNAYDSTKNEFKQRKQMYDDLIHAKYELNKLSELNSIEKIKHSRSTYEIERFKSQTDQEIKLHQTQIRDKCSILEKLNQDHLMHIQSLKEQFKSKLNEIQNSYDQNFKLNEQLCCLNQHLDLEQEKRLDLESKIQTLQETKDFECEINQLSLDEMCRACQDVQQMKSNIEYSLMHNDLPQIKQKIREEFCLENSNSYEQLREEYEYKFRQVEEEYEIIHEKEKQSDLNLLNRLRSEYNQNNLELNDLKERNLCLNSIYDDLSKRLLELRCNLNLKQNNKQCEHLELNDNIKFLKNDLVQLLSCSKSLDIEVALYAKLLNNKLVNTNTTAATTTTTSNICKSCPSVQVTQIAAPFPQPILMKKTITTTTTTTKKTTSAGTVATLNENKNNNNNKEEKKCLVLMNLNAAANSIAATSSSAQESNQNHVQIIHRQQHQQRCKSQSPPNSTRVIIRLIFFNLF